MFDIIELQKSEKVVLHMSQAGIRKQMEILDFIERFQEENGYSPTVREIGAAVGLRS